MVWLPGWSMTPAVYDSLRKKLPHYRHVLVDYSDADTPAEILQRAAAAVKETGRSRLILVGWSLGALLALQLADQGMADSLVLFAATACFVRSKEEKDFGQPDAAVRHMMRALDQDTLAVETAFRTRMLTDAERKEGMETRLSPAGSWTLEALLAGLQLLRSEDMRQALPSIRCPVLLIHGMEDGICPYSGAEELAELLPQAVLYAIPDCGHAPFLGKEDKIANKVRRWLNEQQSDSASI